MNLKRLLLSLVLVVPLAGLAEQNQPVQISADSGHFEQDSQSGVYRGSVELIQGQRKLYADEMHLFTHDGELTRVEAMGNPVRMREGKELSAHAQKLVYDVGKQRLVLTGDAFIKHQGNTFEGARVEYRLDKKTVDASSDGDKRVRLVIPAESQNGNDTETKDAAETPERNDNTGPRPDTATQAEQE